MSHRPITCGKRRYSTGAQARADLERIRKVGSTAEEKPRRAYPCTSCGGFHLTHVPFNQRNAV